MSDIYELFNRKKAISVLEERFEAEDQFDIMEEIIQESDIQFAQLQADIYMNELIIEEAMYNDFDEHYIHGLMESSFSEKKDKFIKFIQDKWAKLKAWFARVVENVKGFFSRNKGAIKAKDGEGKKPDNSHIATALQNCEDIIKTPVFVDNDDASEKCYDLVAKLASLEYYENNNMSLNDSKAKMLSDIGVHDKHGIKKVVEKFFINNPKPVELKVKYLNPKVIMNYALNEEGTIGMIHKCRKSIDGDFKKVIVRIRGAQQYQDKNIDKEITLFNYAMNLKGTIISAWIACVKRVAVQCRSIVNRALSAEANSDGDENNNDN